MPSYEKVCTEALAAVTEHRARKELMKTGAKPADLKLFNKDTRRDYPKN